MAESNDLGQAMISLVRDLEPGLLILVTAVCYLLALMALAQGLLRLLKTSEDKFHAPSAGGTALSFLICIVLAALMNSLGMMTLAGGIALGAITGIGFVAASLASDSAFCGWGTPLFLILSGYRVVIFVVTGAILGIWV